MIRIMIIASMMSLSAAASAASSWEAHNFTNFNTHSDYTVNMVYLYHQGESTWISSKLGPAISNSYTTGQMAFRNKLQKGYNVGPSIKVTNLKNGKTTIFNCFDSSNGLIIYVDPADSNTIVDFDQKIYFDDGNKGLLSCRCYGSGCRYAPS